MRRTPSAIMAARSSGPPGQLSRVIRQPVGPVATFTPWNFPIYLLAKKVSAALAAGLHRDLAAAARDAGLSRPSCSARSPTQAFPPASPNSSTATRPDQRNADRQPHHPQGQLHRLDPRRQASDEALRRQHDARDDGARRPRAGADLRRLRPRKDARHGRAAEVPERRPGVRLARPASTSSAASTTPSSRASPSAPPR